MGKKLVENLKTKTDKYFFAKFNKASIITYIGVCFSILAMYFAFVKVAFDEGERIRYALSCLVVSGVCDMFDGKIARLCKRTKEEKNFGIQLDSLADTICFIVTPIILMFCMGMTQWYCLIAYAMFAIFGISRLGYFNIKADLDTAIKTYSGLPVTSTAIIYPVLGLLHIFVTTKVMNIIYLIATILTGVLFIVNIKIPKLKGVAYIVVPTLALLLILLLLVI